ncbi:MAG TPA: response regulator [Gammaproteobacteria bacterium]|nr:response regulator [Gammaproteobacteria bacterium]
MSDQTILLVEDSPDDVDLTMRALDKNNISNRIVVCPDGAVALEYLHGRGPDGAHYANPLPQVVLLDLKLPKVDGLEVLKVVRAHKRTTLLPIVVLTSSKEEKDMVESYSLGANSYVRKPVSFEEFLEAVRQLGLYWLLLNQSPPLPDDE